MPRHSEAGADDGDLIKEVKDDDDLDMSTLGKPLAAFKQPAAGKAPDGDAAAAPAADSQEPQPEKKKSRKKKHKQHRTTEMLWSQLDAEIADVSDAEDDDELTAAQLAQVVASPAATGRSEGGNGTNSTEMKKRGMLPGGLAGGVSLGANAPLNTDGPKDHTYELVDGEASARVFDTPELRAAFLYYAKSSIKVSEMHLVHEGPFLLAPQFVQMCKDYKLLEPEGKLSMVMVGIVYTASKSDDDEGLAFGQFLDSLVSLAFECETNVAGALQVEWDKKDVLQKKAPPPLLRPPRNASAPGFVVDGETSPKTPGATTPDGGAGGGGLARCTTSRFQELMASSEEGGAPKLKKDTNNKSRFQNIDTMVQSSVLDKVNEVSKIKSMATTRATSMVNSKFSSQRTSTDGADADRPSQTVINPKLLSCHVRQALDAHDDHGDSDSQTSPRVGGSPRTSAFKPAALVGPNGEPISPLFAVAGAVPPSPSLLQPSSPTARGSASGAGGLRPTTANTNRLRLNTDPGIALLAPAKPISLNLVNKGFGDDGNDADEAQEQTAPAVTAAVATATAPQQAAQTKAKAPVAVKAGGPTEGFGSFVGSRCMSESGAMTASGRLKTAAATEAPAPEADQQQGSNQPAPPKAATAAAAETVQQKKPSSDKLAPAAKEPAAAGAPAPAPVSKQAVNAGAAPAALADTEPAAQLCPSPPAATKTAVSSHVTRHISAEGGRISITGETRKKKPELERAPSGRHSDAQLQLDTSKPLSPYELQLAKLEARYKQSAGNASAGASPLQQESSVGDMDRPSPSRRARESQSGGGGKVWRPAGKESLCTSGKLETFAARTGRPSMSGGRASMSGENSSMLRSPSMHRASHAGGSGSGGGGKNSSAAQVPVGGPALARSASIQRGPSMEQLVVVPAVKTADAADAQPAAGALRAAAAKPAASDDKRAQIEAQLAMLEKRLGKGGSSSSGGIAAVHAPHPPPAAQPSKSGASPRVAATAAAGAL